MKIRLLFLATVLLPFGLAAQDPISVNDPVLERLDALSQLPWLKNDPFTTDVGKLNTHNFAPDVVPTYSPEVFQQRMLELDERTPFKLTYNKQVQAYIDMYAERKRDQTARMLGMAQLYFPAFEEALDRYGLPQELKYLAVVESALYPGARSRAAAVGLWQFIIGTGKLYGLRVDSYVDERCDVYKSTDAACRYLRDLHEAFGDWELALAAYNCGPGNVNKAVRRAGGTMDYWKIYDHLPRETRGYVPAFIAVNYIFNHASDHNIYPVIPNYCAYEVDTMQIRYPLELDRLAGILGADSTELRDLNPMFKVGVVPVMDGPATVYIPRTLTASFIQYEDTIARSYVPDVSTPAPVTYASVTKGSSKSYTHVVRSGESLGLIAQRNSVSIQDLRRWNHLHGDRIRAGQRLLLHHEVVPEPVTTTKEPDEAKAVPASPGATEYIYHTVQPGDTLWGIAQNYPGVSLDDLKRLNANMNFRHLTVGEKIKVGVEKG
ncbi:MAG TPA: LysM peptidoglycan-binding domain-containing protein [Flavobacteriales bacterium]|nr:LysM peptidoglycan-binding domain-containing protein [Flavobacteriales bacterium]QQS71590.1 MAG: LysM peptidoglycan-binding domain-containing protein [Flavobacteriales bacterium]HQV38530.1 LysM peptidoglycan-binding domain-containing protein [Flavobacteriales bacterium]HQW31964.1 LysM peptidoglycan-binding domain-containing protein [Flavobacteriales bacterium]HQY02582.1 LysM peptidoglycan-binding domain-containing protein [Flavobacteriales bacterium]